ncbi:hypothetical protein [Campylobacter lanienae]|uniref:hypothetical protein n=1 Tax=Campylobacter lanienae TaxID=75658 RepID=UPI000BB43D76|nr:hypothetical protein [Campylobacter lanienae]
MADKLKTIYKLPKNYKAEFSKKCQKIEYSNTLIISFSVNDNFDLYKYIVDFDTLYLACDPKIFYFGNVEEVSLNLEKIIIENNYTNIILVGTSKGGFASCLYGILLAKRLRDISFNVLSFSGGGCLYPVNKHFLENFKNPFEYKRLLNIANEDSKILSDLQKYGNLESLLLDKMDNIQIYAVAGKNEIADAYEVQRIAKYQNVKSFFIDISSHFSSMPFMLNNKDVENIKRLKNLLMLSVFDYFNLKNDEIELNKIANEISSVVKNGNLRSLNEIFELLAQEKEISFTKDNK